MNRSDMEQLWSEHLDGEFTSRDVDATLATMVDDADVNHVPVNTGGHGKDELRAFYRDVFIPGWPEDQHMTALNRVVGDDQLVDELRASFTHNKRMDWFLPDIEPTHRRVEVDFVVVVQFRDGRIAAERIYWDHARVLRQVGLLA